MNALMNTRAASATQMIRSDHAMVLAQFHKLTPDTSPTVRDAVIRTICTALEIHATVEEELFYPVLRESGIGEPTIGRSVPEHDEMRRLIEQVRSLRDQPRERQAALNQLMNAVMHHVADEETLLLPAAENALGADRLADIGHRMTQRKMQLAKPRTAAIASDLAIGAPAKTGLMAVGMLVAGTLLLSRLRRNGRASAY